MVFESEKDFLREYAEYDKTDNIKIHYILVESSFVSILLDYDSFNLTSPEKYGAEVRITDDGIGGALVGYWDGMMVLDVSNMIDDYIIKTTKKYEVCELCSEAEMYDVNKEKYYCPLCSREGLKYPIRKIMNRIENYLSNAVEW